MRNVTKFSALALAAALAAGPVLAQTTNQAGTAPTAVAPMMGSPAAGTSATAPATHNESTVRTTGAMPSERNPALADTGDVRASKVIGSSVYNDRDEKIGSVDDLLIGRDSKPLTAVISVGGFLGAGNKLVAVPYSSLKFGDAKAGSDNRVVMPGATKQSLKSMSDYHFSSARHDMHRG